MGLDRGLNSSSTNPLGIDDDDYTATTRGAQGPQGDDGASTQDYIDKYNTVVSSAAAASVNETNSATSATSSANSATASASSASASSTSKDTSTAQATIATTKAGEASTSATNSATSATNSANSATASASSASTAATQATLATTNGAAQVALATTQAGLATTNGAAQVTLATAQASTATTKASEAATSATNSATSATSSASSATASANSATAAASSATGAASSATTATTKASEASTSATASAASLASFTGQYVSQATAPSSPSEGDLWFDTTANTMKVYDGSGFINAGSSVNGIENSVQHTATAGQTSFTATYDAGFLQVYLNGLRLDAEDYTATNGSTVVLDTGATLNDVVFIHSFGTFVLADHYTKSEDDALLAAKLPLTGGAMTGDVSHGDNVKAKFGASDDLQIYHDGGNTWIKENGTGQLFIEGTNLRLRTSTGANYFLADENGRTGMFYSGTEKLSTTATGVAVTGGIAIGGTGAANTLDDYEEGVANLTYVSTGSTFNYSVRKCYYTKVGRIVHISVYMQLDGAQTLSANTVHISGLPFAAANNGGQEATAICAVRYVNYRSGYNALQARISPNQSKIDLYEQGDNQSGVGLVANQLSNSSGQIFFTMSYIAA